MGSQDLASAGLSVFKMKIIVVISTLIVVVSFSVLGGALQAQASVYDKYVEEYNVTPQPTIGAGYTAQDSADDVQRSIQTATTYALILLLGFYLVKWVIKKVRPTDAAPSIDRILPKGSAIIVVAALVLGGVFYYWFSIRPANIRRECLKVMGREPNFANKITVGKYEACLIEHGLNP